MWQLYDLSQHTHITEWTLHKLSSQLITNFIRTTMTLLSNRQIKSTCPTENELFCEQSLLCAKGLRLKPLVDSRCVCVWERKRWQCLVRAFGCPPRRCSCCPSISPSLLIPPSAHLWSVTALLFRADGRVGLWLTARGRQEDTSRVLGHVSVTSHLVTASRCMQTVTENSS